MQRHFENYNGKNSILTLHILRLPLLLLLLVLVANFNLISLQAEPLNPKNNSPAAVIEDDTITVGSIDALILSNPQYAPMEKMLSADDEKLKQLRSMVLESLIDRTLLLNAAKKSEAVSKEAAAEKVAELIQENGGEEKLNAMLKQRGTSYSEFVDNLTGDIIISEYINKDLGKGFAVTEADSKKFFEEHKERFSKGKTVRARHILVKTEKDANKEELAAAEKEVNSLYEQVKKEGNDFAAIAKKHSSCPSAAKGGDLGFFEAKQMVPEFSAAAFSLKPGEISKPVKTQFGYHVIKVEEVKDAQTADFKSAQPAIEQQLEAKAKSEIAQKKIKELRAENKIEILL